MTKEEEENSNHWGCDMLQMNGLDTHFQASVSLSRRDPEMCASATCKTITISNVPELCLILCQWFTGKSSLQPFEVSLGLATLSRRSVS